MHQARYFGIDLLCQAVLSNHVHPVLRSRPNVVQEWDDSEVARRWLMLLRTLCSERTKRKHGRPLSEDEGLGRGSLKSAITGMHAAAVCVFWTKQPCWPVRPFYSKRWESCIPEKTFSRRTQQKSWQMGQIPETDRPLRLHALS